MIVVPGQIDPNWIEYNSQKNYTMKKKKKKRKSGKNSKMFTSIFLTHYKKVNIRTVFFFFLGFFTKCEYYKLYYYIINFVYFCVLF